MFKNGTRGTVKVSCYGHFVFYQGLISFSEKEKRILIEKEKEGDHSIQFPLVKTIGKNPKIEILSVEEIFDDNKKLVYKRK